MHVVSYGRHVGVQLNSGHCVVEGLKYRIISFTSNSNHDELKHTDHNQSSIQLHLPRKSSTIPPISASPLPPPPPRIPSSSPLLHLYPDHRS